MKVKYEIKLNISLNEKDIDWENIEDNFDAKSLNIFYFLKEIHKTCQKFVTAKEDPIIEASIKDVIFKQEIMN